MAEQAPPVPPISVLVVNDNDPARYMTGRMLRNAGFRVLEASTGQEALEKALLQPDVMVLDVKLPDLDGFEVCRRLRADPRTSSITVVQTSATFVTLDKKVRGLESGADSYLTQPFEPQELVATVRALARLRKAEQALRLRTVELLDADRRKDEFLAMLAHELRNPLSALSAALPLVERRAPQDAVEQHAREVMHRQLRQLSHLVDDLLDVARVTQGKIELRQQPLDLCRLVARVVEEKRPQFAARSQRLQLEACAPAVVEGDPTRLEQVLVNLLDNASKYTDPGGAVWVTVGTEPGKVQVRVKDTGVGIGAEALPRIFDLFAQAPTSLARSRGGLGIGLTLVRTLVEMHGGQVEARSDGEGRGSEFVLTLPLTTQPEPRAQRPAALAEGQGRRILIVEDNVDGAETLRDLCELWGHQVSTASDGLSGVSRILEERPEVALVDIGLPGIDGYEVARRVRAQPQGQQITLVALSGYGAPEQRQQALESGFDLHLVKPPDPDHLERLLATLKARP